jgi:hypothetical protein
MRCVLAAAGAFALAAPAAGATSGGPPHDPAFEYLYIDANEDGASGGHTAIRFGDQTYHFTYQEPGVLSLQRLDSEHFVHRYATLENRSIEVQRVAVPGGTYELLREAFNQRFLEERKEYDLLAALRADRALVEEAGGGTITLSMRAAGYFASDAPGPARQASPNAALARLRRRAEQRYGPDFLRREAKALEEDIARLDLAEIAGMAQLTATDGAEGPPEIAYGIERRLADRATRLRALSVLSRAAELRSDATLRLDRQASKPSLARDEVVALEDFARTLEEDLVELLSSQRPDAGHALLVGMARLSALDRSLREQRFVVLDAYPADAVSIGPDEIAARGGDLKEILGRTQVELERARALFRRTSSPRESDYALLEEAVNRVHEIERAITAGRAIRVVAMRLVPARSAQTAMPVLMAGDPARLQALATQLRAEEESASNRLQAKHRYDLVRRNCVTEIFAEMESVLGDRVPSGQALSFIPFASARAVERAYPVEARSVIPSHRRARMKEMAESESPLLVAMRESNVLTSTVYRHNENDSLFLFFTDGAIAPRPLLGAVNLAVGLGATALGIPLIVADRGETLWRGLRGALWSLPEVLFINVRKGTFFSTPADSTPPDSRELRAAAVCADRAAHAERAFAPRVPPRRGGRPGVCAG